MKKLIGQYFIGNDPIELYVDTESRDGGVQLTGDWVVAGKVTVPRLTVGVHKLSWVEVVDTFLHEAYEFALSRRHCRYVEDYRINETPAHCLFVFTHEDFTEATAMVATIVAAAVPALADAYKESNEAPAPADPIAAS